MRVRSIVLASALVGAATFTVSPAVAQEAGPDGGQQAGQGPNEETPAGQGPNEETPAGQGPEETPAEETPAEEAPAAEQETQQEDDQQDFAEAEEEEFDEIPVTVNPTSGGPGTRVTITAPCDDEEDFGAAFLPADKEGDQESDFVEITDVTVSGGILTARFTIPAGSAPGDALFFVGCGDDVGAADFRVLGAGGTAGSGAARPAQAVRGEAAFTG